MLGHLRDGEGSHPPFVRAIAVLLVLALTFGVLVTAVTLLQPFLHWLLPALF